LNRGRWALQKLITHEEVLEAGKKAAADFVRLLSVALCYIGRLSVPVFPSELNFRDLEF